MAWRLKKVMGAESKDPERLSLALLPEAVLVMTCPRDGDRLHLHLTAELKSGKNVVQESARGR